MASAAAVCSFSAAWVCRAISWTCPVLQIKSRLSRNQSARARASAPRYFTTFNPKAAFNRVIAPATSCVSSTAIKRLIVCSGSLVRRGSMCSAMTTPALLITSIRILLIGHWSLLSFRFPQFVSLRSELNTRSTFRFSARSTPTRAYISGPRGLGRVAKGE
jgi:hypothetical protein